MAAPTPTARVLPDGRLLQGGFKSLITLARDTNIKFWEKTVQPPSLDGGEPIDFSTMHNTRYHTKAPRSLIDMGPVVAVCEYDPKVYDEIRESINEPTTVTVLWKDGSTLAFYGWLQKFETAAMEEGAAPEATVTICPSNWDYVNDVEAAPVLTEVSGT